MHQHVQAQALLHFHGVADLRVHRLGVLGGRQLALLERLAGQADRRGLREGADGGGGERRQVQPRTLLLDAHGERRLAPAVLGLDRRQARLHRRLVDARRAGAAFLHRAAFGQRGVDAARRVQRASQGGDLGALLHGEGQPAVQLGIQLVLAVEVDRAVQQRAGRRHPQVAAKALFSLAQLRQRLVEVAAPDVATVDHAERQHLVGG
ncbi:hypothetical protein D9M68_540990 [compost metagenome]